jgi:hypothetical protein
MLKYLIAGWSSLVARRAHNPKVASSNLAPATKVIKRLEPVRKHRLSCFEIGIRRILVSDELGPDWNAADRLTTGPRRRQATACSVINDIEFSPGPG